MTEPNHQVRPAVSQTEKARELRPQRCYLDRLVEKRVANAQGSRLQGEALVTAPHFHPMHFVVGVADEDGDASGAAHLFGTFIILTFRRDD